MAALTAHGAAWLDPAAVGPARLGAALVALLHAAPEATLLVDDASRLAIEAGPGPDAGSAAGPGEEPVDEALLRRMQTPQQDDDRPRRRPAGPGPHLLVGCTPAQAAVAFRGVLPLLRQARTGLLLGAVAPGDGEALGVQVAPRPAGPVGRALLVTSGRVRAVQLADPTPVPASVGGWP